MYQQNFLNCPQSLFNGSDHCAAVKKFLETNDKCGEMIENIFLTDVKFWFDLQFDEDEQDEPESVTAES